jgi:hypothetical protein
MAGQSIPASYFSPFFKLIGGTNLHLFAGHHEPLCRSVFGNLANAVDATQTAMKLHCPDVGVENGGWGEVIVEMKVVKAQE